VVEVVEVLARTDDEISEAGLAAMLGASPQLRLVRGQFSAGAKSRVVVMAPEATALKAAFAELRRVRDQAGGRAAPHCVLITDHLREEELMTAIECGVSAVLPRADADATRLVGAVFAVSKGAALLPAELQGALFAQLAQICDSLLSSHDLTLFGLTARERAVLRMIADGRATGEISEQLGCSEGTVKNVLYALMSRLNLKTRMHAVAYAIRTGVI
jgi:DNA-binding NarL/FixJ family response regulator